ncbi:MAG: nucleotide exchange factor GrpE [Clostridiales Family XIII bacterium]|jgi:molecular chaperone GrpE|nr:nucleotide exchange factor GrpE [Clostridiales Family XIII bacterium]
MTTIKAKPGGAQSKRPTQAFVKKGAAESEKEARRASGGRKEADKAAEERPGKGEAARAAEPGKATEPGPQTVERTARDEDANARYMRLAADFQNYKRRVEKEKSEVYAYANEKIAVDLLGVLDNFERALQDQGGAEAQEEGFVKGMGLIFKQLQDILLKNGVAEIQSLGEEFDPAIHNAVMMEETDAYESGRVSAVLNKGYRLKDRVIRPAMVKVAQ